LDEAEMATPLRMGRASVDAKYYGVMAMRDITARVLRLLMR